MKVLPTIIPQDTRTEHTLYQTGLDFVKGKFTKWNTDHFVTEVTITKSSFDKRIELVNYCDKTNSIEIHFYEKGKDPFKEDSFNITDCKIDCLRVFLQVYAQGEKVCACSSVDGSRKHPETKKGNIIQGNP